jgi:hypothetical protein
MNQAMHFDTLMKLATMPPELLERLLYIGRIIQLAEKSSKKSEESKNVN